MAWAVWGSTAQVGLSSCPRNTARASTTDPDYGPLGSTAGGSSTVEMLVVQSGSRGSISSDQFDLVGYARPPALSTDLQNGPTHSRAIHSP